MTTLPDLNSCDSATFVERLRGIYEHSPWIPERAAARRPFANVTALKLALQDVVSAATLDEQLGLIRAHPELAGKAAVAGQLTAESTSEQAKSGLHLCSAEEFATLHQLNADYNAKFGFPFILAVKGPTGQGLTRQSVIATFARRLKNQRADEIAECLRQIKRIAEIRLNDLLAVQLDFGPAIMQWSEDLAAWSDDENALTCAYMTSAHRQTAAQLLDWMREAGMDAHIDAVGNVAGIYRSDAPNAKTLITGSHYDTVRNGGKYDGRLGILLPIAIVRHLHQRGEKLPFNLEVIGFAEEEGVRFKSTFLGSTAITGRFDLSLLDQTDADGVTMRDALLAAGHDVARIPAIARNPADLLGFVEVHIEQGPVLLERDLALGVVTAIAGSSRYLLDLTGLASHAGTTPMTMRKGRRRCRRRNRAAGRTALRADAIAGRHGRPVAGAEWLGQRHPRRLQAVARYPRRRRCRAPGRRQGCNGRHRRHLRAPPDRIHAATAAERQRRAVRATPDAAIRRRHRTRRPAALRPAVRRRPRCDGDGRHHRRRHAVHALRQRRHQPQSAGDHDRR